MVHVSAIYIYTPISLTLPSSSFGLSKTLINIFCVCSIALVSVTEFVHLHAPSVAIKFQKCVNKKKHITFLAKFSRFNVPLVILRSKFGLLYGGSVIVVMSFVDKNFCTTNEKWTRTWKLCKIQLFSASFQDRC